MKKFGGLWMLIKRPIRDKVALSFISGILGTLVMYSVGIPLYFLKVAKVIYLIYTFEVFVTPELARTVPGFLAGFVTGLLVGAVLALGFKLIIEWTGYDWIWLKAVGYGGLMWFVWVGIMRNLLDVTPYLVTDIRTNIILLLQSEIYIFATTWFMIKLAGGKEAVQFSDVDKRK